MQKKHFETLDRFLIVLPYHVNQVLICLLQIVIWVLFLLYSVYCFFEHFLPKSFFQKFLKKNLSLWRSRCFSVENAFSERKGLWSVFRKLISHNIEKTVFICVRSLLLKIDSEMIENKIYN